MEDNDFLKCVAAFKKALRREYPRADQDEIDHWSNNHMLILRDIEEGRPIDSNDPVTNALLSEFNLTVDDIKKNRARAVIKIMRKLKRFLI